jgi:hypothetical protein
MNFEKFIVAGKARGVRMIWELFLKADTITKYSGMMIKLAYRSENKYPPTTNGSEPFFILWGRRRIDLSMLKPLII